MKEYFTNKNMLIGILLALLGISIMDVIMSITLLKENAVYKIDYGSAIVTLAMSVLLIIFALNGKDRLFYIVCGGWLAYFVLSMVFVLPAIVAATFGAFNDGSGVTYIAAIIFRLISTVGIIVIGGLLAEYMVDGTLYEKAFTVSCTVTMLLLLIYAIMSLYDMARTGTSLYFFATLFALTNLIMVFLFSYFAFDSAKAQLSKTQL